MSLETIQHLSELTGKSRSTIVKAANALGLKPIARGKAKLYESKALLPYLFAPPGETTGADGGPLDFHSEKTRLTKRQREKIELDIKVRAGELVPTVHVVHVVTNMIANCKARLLGIPTKLAPEAAIMDDPNEIKALAKGFITEALNELKDYDGSARAGE